MATSFVFQRLCKRSYHAPSKYKLALYNGELYHNPWITLSHRTALSAHEPRKRLPITIHAIKKDVSKMQHNIANANFTVPMFPFNTMIVFITLVTYTICYTALDPDQIAEWKVEVDMYGLKGFITHLMDPNYMVGGSDDEEDEYEYEIVDDNSEEEEGWEYYYEEHQTDSS
eukprot:122646_1